MATKGTRGAREARLELVARLYLTGHSQREIGEQLGLTQQQISKDFTTLNARWQSKEGCWDTHKSQELAKLNNLERIHHAAWERSCEDKEVATTEKISGGSGGANGDRLKAAKRTEGQAGDPRFLDGVLKVIQQRIDLLRPQEERSATAVNVTVNNNSMTLANMSMDEFSALPPDEMARILRG